jgi:L-asparaginase
MRPTTTLLPILILTLGLLPQPGFSQTMRVTAVPVAPTMTAPAQAAPVQTAPAQAAPAPSAPLPRVRLVATGGTISNKVGGRLTADELVASMPGLDRYVRPEAEQFANTSSSVLSLAQWLELARRINTLLAEEPDLAGVVVTSGTDTLEETAYFLDLTVRTDKPIVVVGSMRNPSTLGYEGAANLLEGFRVAASPDARGQGVLVVLNDEINAAREVTKTDALRLNTFQSRGYGVLGVVDSDRVVFYRKVVKKHTSDSEFDVSTITELPRVDVVMTYQGASGDIIKAIVDQGARGIVLATAGAGATSGTQPDGIQYAIEKGVFVVTSTRTGSGRIAARPRGTAAPTSSSNDGERQARPNQDRRIAAEDLAPVKARILLMLALTRTTEGSEIQRMFTEY